MLQFDLRKSSRRCHASDRAFEPGEVFYSALIELPDGGSERRDFGIDQWEEPTEDCLGWWRAKVPERDQGKVYWAPRSVLLSYFEHTLEHEATRDIAYVVGLLLVQKRHLTLIDDGEQPELLHLHQRSEKRDFHVPVVDLAPDRLAAIQQELAERLFMDEPVDLDEVGNHEEEMS